MPFWLKADSGGPWFFMTAKCPSGECLAVAAIGELVEQSTSKPGGISLGGVLLGTFCLGTVFGPFLGWLVGWIRGFIRKVSIKLSGWWKGPASAWERTARKAIRFVAKRRLVSFAFSAYRDYSLRNTPSSKPTTLRRERLATSSPRRTPRTAPLEGPLTPLREGPVLRRDHGNGP